MALQLFYFEGGAIVSGARMAEMEEAAQRYYRRALEDSRPVVQAGGEGAYGISCWVQGRIAEAAAHLTRAIELFGPAVPDDVFTAEQMLMTVTFDLIVQAMAGTRSDEETFATFELLTDTVPPVAVAPVCAMAVDVALLLERHDVAAAYDRRLEAASPSADFAFWGGQLVMHRGLQQIRRGAVDEGLATFKRRRAAVPDHRRPLRHGPVPRRARRRGARAPSRSRRRAPRDRLDRGARLRREWSLSHLHVVSARVHAEAGDVVAATAQLAEAVRVARAALRRLVRQRARRGRRARPRHRIASPPWARRLAGARMRFGLLGRSRCARRRGGRRRGWASTSARVGTAAAGGRSGGARGRARRRHLGRRPADVGHRHGAELRLPPPAAARGERRRPPHPRRCRLPARPRRRRRRHRAVRVPRRRGPVPPGGGRPPGPEPCSSRPTRFGGARPSWSCSTSAAAAAAARLEERRLAAIDDRLDANLALGAHTSVAAELAELVAAHPLREGLRARLALALYRSGRQADALRALADAGRTLRDELGIEPSRQLRDLEAAILAHDPALDLPAVPVAAFGAAHRRRRRHRRRPGHERRGAGTRSSPLSSPPSTRPPSMPGSWSWRASRASARPASPRNCAGSLPLAGRSPHGDGATRWRGAGALAVAPPAAVSERGGSPGIADSPRFRVRVANAPPTERRLEGRGQLPARHRHVRRPRPLAPQRHASWTHRQEQPAPAGPDDCSRVQSRHSDPTVASSRPPFQSPNLCDTCAPPAIRPSSRQNRSCHYRTGRWLAGVLIPL